MTQEEMLRALSAIQINGNISQLCMGDGSMTVNYNYPQPATAAAGQSSADQRSAAPSSADQSSMPSDDRRMGDILRELLEARDEDGHRLMTEQQQWFAVYHVLKEYCNYPSTMSDFARAMVRFGMDRATPPCKVESLRKAGQSLPRLACKVSLWHQFGSLGPGYAKQCRVARWLMERIE